MINVNKLSKLSLLHGESNLNDISNKFLQSVYGNGKGKKGSSRIICLIVTED